MKRSALIMAGGSGIRMGGKLPKQFALLSGKPVLMHTLERFHSYDPQMLLVLVLPKDQMDLWIELCDRYSFMVPHETTTGGQERFHSVQNGLRLLDDQGIVFIHDAVRPLVSLYTLERCFLLAVEKGNAVPVVPVSESVRFGDAAENRPIDRNQTWLVQTPQVFLSQSIKEAYTQNFQPSFTDDASVLEHTVKRIWLTEGNRENIKLTWPADISMAEILLSSFDLGLE